MGQATASQRTGVMVHPTQDLLLLYSVSSDNAGDAFLNYCQEQVDKELPGTTLELHQLLDRCTSTAERMSVGLSLVAIAIIDGHVALAAYQGSVWLKRGAKVGQILSAEAALQILEGKTQAEDIYVMLTQAASSLSPALHESLAKTTAADALKFIEQPTLREAVTSGPAEASMGISVVTVLDTETQTTDDATSSLHDTTLPTAVTPSEVAARLSEQPVEPTPPLRKVGQVVGGGVHGVVKFYSAITNEIEQLFSQDVYVRQKHRRSVGKVLAAMALILVIIIGGFTLWKRNEAAKQQQVTDVLQPYRQQFNAFKELSVQDPVTARQQLATFIVELEVRAQDTTQPQHVQQALQAELKTVRDFNQSISGQTQLPLLPTFFDLRLVQSNFLASRIDVTSDTLFFLDSGQKKILALNIERKQPTILPVGEYPDIRAMIADDEYLYFLGQGLFRFTLSGTEVATLVENSDDITSAGQSLGLFGKYLYVLNKEQNNIFRYDTEDDELDSKPVGWIQPGQGIDLGTVQSFAIDGDVWLSTETGEIKKLASGRETAFTVTGLTEPFSSPITIFTKPELQNLYILESAKSRMVVLNKEGEFVKEVKSNELAGAMAVVASEKHQKAFALSGSLVYEMGL